MSDRWTFGCGVSLRRGRSDGFVSEIACAAFGDVDARPVVAGDVTSFRAGMPGISMPGGTALSFRSKSSFIMRA